MQAGDLLTIRLFIAIPQRNIRLAKGSNIVRKQTGNVLGTLDFAFYLCAHRSEINVKQFLVSSELCVFGRLTYEYLYYSGI